MLERLRAWWRARQRGEKRVAPPGVRGRVYVRKDALSDGGPDQIKVDAEPQAYISARVIRADGRVEDLGVIAGPRGE